jgi:GNAT superfamily N-acetyltransferase
MTTGAITRIRQLSNADLALCRALTDEHGWAYADQKWLYLLTNTNCFGIDDPAGGLAAMALLARYGPDLAGIGTMLVAGRFARQGLGTALIQHALAQAGDATVFLYATSNGRPLYAKLGFRTFFSVANLVGEFAAETAARTTRPATTADLPAILRLDAEVFGADRAGLVSALFDYAGHVRVLNRDGRITGYAAGFDNPDNVSIGPLVAANETDARALITDIAVRADRPIRLDVDANHPGLIAWAEAHGLVDRRPTAFMAHGPGRLPGDRTRLFLPINTALG